MGNVDPLVSVKDISVPWPCGISLKIKGLGVSVICGETIYVVPVTLTEGLESLSATWKVPVCVPWAVGANCSVYTQEEFAGTVTTQVLAITLKALFEFA
jgi:hypothetical protein